MGVPTLEEQIRDQVIATCNSTKLRRKLLTESDLTLEKVLQIGQSMEQAQHHLSTIEQKSTSNQEELNVLPYHRRSPPKKPFQKNHQKQNQNFDHRNTHQQGQKQHTSNNQVECSRCGTKGHRGNACRRSKNRTYSKCNKVGHFKRMCRSKEKRHQQNAINSTITELSNPNADTDSDNEDPNADTDSDNAEVMCYYNPIAETNIIVDAVSKGLGAILCQKQKNGQFKKPISYSSKALTDVESRYS